MDSGDTYEDNDEGMDGTERWMEKYWGLREEFTLSEDESGTDEETELSSEEGRRERAAVGKRNEGEGESDEEMESDLGSLRELGSEGEWEPFHRLQILYGSNRRRGEDEWSGTEEEGTPSVTTSELRLDNLPKLCFQTHVLVRVLGPLCFASVYCVLKESSCNFQPNL